MDRRSWLWRRSSSEKSRSGEAESSGSGSGYSQSEVEEVTDSQSVLSERLAEALVNIQEKEDLVKQHEKIAEEAVSGWEKAETEVVSLRKQIEILTQKNSVLDEALKECLRQLCQVREDQEHKIFDAIKQKSIEWESTKCELESQVVELQSQLHCNRSEASWDPDIHAKLEAAEQDISILISRINSLREELELITHERDLSSRAAEIASKQRLDCIKKVVSLEADCRRLKASAHRAKKATDNRSVSSIYAESLTDSQSDGGERLSVTEIDNCKIDDGLDCMPGTADPWAFSFKAESDKYMKEKPSASKFMSSSLEINLMDDFLDMERLAALPQIAITSEGEHTADLELESTRMKLRKSMEYLEKMEVELVELQIQLDITNEAKLEAEMEVGATNRKVQNSMDRLEEIECYLEELQNQLATSNEAKGMVELDLETTKIKLKQSSENLDEMDVYIEHLQNQLKMANEGNNKAKVKTETDTKIKDIEEPRLIETEVEMQTLLSKIIVLEDEVRRLLALPDEAVDRCKNLDGEISRFRHQKAANFGELGINQDKANKFADCQKTIASLGQQLKSLANIEDFFLDQSETTLEDLIEHLSSEVDGSTTTDS